MNLKDQEFILRFFALYYNSTDYEEPMKHFLNQYMSYNRDLQRNSKEELTNLFENTIKAIYKCLHTEKRIKAFRPEGRLNVAVFDATMVGVASRLRRGSITDCSAFIAAYEQLVQSAEFRNVTGVATAHLDKVRTRLKLAITAFQDVK